MSCGLNAVSEALPPQKKKLYIYKNIYIQYISWGKHWTEIFMDLSLAVLQSNK